METRHHLLALGAITLLFAGLALVPISCSGSSDPENLASSDSGADDSAGSGTDTPTDPGPDDPADPGPPPPPDPGPEPPPDPGGGSPPALQLKPVATGLVFPVFLTSPPTDPRLFILERSGRIRIVQNGTLLPDPFLDLGGQVSTTGERGLLGMAFHPSYASNGFFYVKYTDLNGDLHVVRYTVGSDPNRADPASAKRILFTDQPRPNHNAGMVLFGPDGKFYIPMGDGGGAGDPDGHAQNPATVFGKVLRIDVDAGDPYAIPPDNPLVGVPGAREEIWAMGLRNPWRASFDRGTGLFYIADVGEYLWEEIHIVPSTAKAINYGWAIMEGKHCFDSSGCDQTGLTFPVVEYDHQTGRCAVTGGYVYRGSRIPGLQGTYFYGDYCDGVVRSFRYANGVVTEHQAWNFDIGHIPSFGEDAAGELYVLSSAGTVGQIVSPP